MFVTYLFDQKAIDDAGLTQNLEGRHTQTVEDPQGRDLTNTPQTGSVWNSVLLWPLSPKYSMRHLINLQHHYVSQGNWWRFLKHNTNQGNVFNNSF